MSKTINVVDMEYMVKMLGIKMMTIPLMLMGVLAPRSAHARAFARPPIDMSGNFQSHLQTSPPTPQKSYPKFQNPRTTFENTPLFLS